MPARRQSRSKKPRKRATKPAQWRKAFLAALARHGNATLAAEQARISRPVPYRHRAEDPVFAAAWAEAMEEAADHLEFAAWQRATEGWEEPVYGSLGPGQGGGQIGSIRRFSTALLIFLLKGIRPEKYRDRFDFRHMGQLQVQHDHKLADTIATDPQAAQLAYQLLERMGAGSRDAGRPGRPG